MILLSWNELIPEAQIYILKKQYAEHHKYDIKPFEDNITASNLTGGFNWSEKDSPIMLDIIFGNFRSIFKVCKHLFLYKYIIK